MRRSLRFTALVVAIIAVLLLVLHRPVLTALGSYLVKAEAPQKADVVFVLAGDVSGHRILKAAELVRDGYAPRIVVSGPWGYYGFYECDLAIPFAVKSGYPESYFLRFPNRSLSTRDEARAAAAEFHSLGVHHVILVTSLFHTRRAARLFRAAAPDITFTMVSAPDQNFTADGWWHNREAEKIFLIEWLKTGASWFSL